MAKDNTASTTDKAAAKPENSKSTKAAIERIEQYLDRRAATDPQFAQAYSKPGKNIDACIGYICNEVRRSGKTLLTDDEVYGMAVHYFDEDSISGSPIPSGVRIVATETTEDTSNGTDTVAAPAVKSRSGKKPTRKTAAAAAIDDLQLSIFSLLD